MRIVVATSNPHKVEEIRAVFASEGNTGIELVGLGDVTGAPFREPDEVGSTFEENARIKAVSYAAQTGELCLADDSGLEIDGLGGRPGVISSHYCTDGRETGLSRAERDRLNNERVMRELEGMPEAKRGARFVCVMVVADGTGVVTTARGVFEGRIGTKGEVPRGENGFGYDPLFLVAPGFERTGAELLSTEKNLVSHRGRAAQEVGRWVARLNR